MSVEEPCGLMLLSIMQVEMSVKEGFQAYVVFFSVLVDLEGIIDCFDTVNKFLEVFIEEMTSLPKAGSGILNLVGTRN